MKDKKIRIGIMGFGRIGRIFYTIAQNNPLIDIVAISDIGQPEILHYLLQCDNQQNSNIRIENNYLVSANSKTRMLQGGNPQDVPWDVLGVDVVVDATHKFCSKTQMEGHIISGAKRVIISALPRDEIDRIVIVGVNDSTIKSNDKLISAGSSTTNAIGLLLKILSKDYSIDNAMMTTVHAFTSDQPLQDTVGKSFRRSRSAAENIIPNDSPTPKWIEKIMPEFKNKIEGIALNVPIPKGSLLDTTIFLNDSEASIQDINDTMIRASKQFPNSVEVIKDPIVSCDVLDNPRSILFDLSATMKSKNRIVKTLCWYDNGYSQACRILDIILAYNCINGSEELS
ncbi:MAG: glyceraldehyde-3-phosphate dehydrogenase [Candidatus Marinimicrobia bacterium]|nr:glyceraldehyde-3-phosphate dehydrogenase [Candidatus Neomarinimicrobiota bacterium]MBL7023748.1 glyceraldehyde-3-phosphate dehydrogenase [Candidatus Neomarinimicrobiota bacterium]MBL7108617.1 glyceraldehyde-3-phosphate dehydrogenase [Candidatus Neomarinimicrobiota bacterium]